MTAFRITLARGGVLLLLIHALTAAAALGTVAPLYDDLAGALAARGAGPVLTSHELSLVIEVLGRHALPLARAAWPWLLTFTLLSPVLVAALAHALATGATAAASLRAAATRTLAVVAVRVFGISMLAAGVAVLTLSYGFTLAFVPALLELPLQLGYLALLALHALGCATFHDLALARLALRRTSLSRALMAALLRTTPRMLALRGAAAAAALGLAVLADLCGRVPWPLPGMLAPALATALAQSLLFGGLVCRALFLLRVVRPLPDDPRSSFSILPPVSLPPP